MSRRSLAPLLGLLALLVVIGPGSPGAASALKLNKGAVKRIAAAVVDAKAPSLSVKHAVTADSAATAATATTAGSAANADKVGGLSAAQLGTRTYVLSIPDGQTHNGQVIYPLTNIPPGQYLVTFDGIFETSAAHADAFIINEATGDLPLQTSTPASGGVASVAAAGYVSVSAGDDMRFSVVMSGAWGAAFPAELTLTPILQATASTLTPAP